MIANPVTIPYCMTVSGNICLQCINGFYTKDGGCALANILCASYDPTNGRCFSCVPGHVFQEGECIYPSQGIDPNCVYYTNSFCSRCATNFALINFVCSTIDRSCLSFNQNTNTCERCEADKVAMGPICV